MRRSRETGCDAHWPPVQESCQQRFGSKIGKQEKPDEKREKQEKQDVTHTGRRFKVNCGDLLTKRETGVKTGEETGEEMGVKTGEEMGEETGEKMGEETGEIGETGVKRGKAGCDALAAGRRELPAGIRALSPEIASFVNGGSSAKAPTVNDFPPLFT